MARPIEFDRSDVLDRATRLFWDKGYCATSISDLVRVTGLNPGSIYGAFNSKEGLFLTALEFYGEHSIQKLKALLAGSDDPLRGIVFFLQQLVDEHWKRTGQRGCFLVNTTLEVAPHNRKVKQRVMRYFDGIEQCFADVFERAAAEALLDRGQDPVALAKFLMTTIWGIRVMQRLGTDKAGLQKVVNEYLSYLGRQRPTSKRKPRHGMEN